MENAMREVECALRGHGVYEYSELIVFIAKKTTTLAEAYVYSGLDEDGDIFFGRWEQAGVDDIIWLTKDAAVLLAANILNTV